ncbi:MAG: hypothetical protein WCA35_26700 [Kovacikia sp.]
MNEFLQDSDCAIAGRLNNYDRSLSMIVALRKWETSVAPAVAVEPVEHWAIASNPLDGFRTCKNQIAIKRLEQTQNKKRPSTRGAS